MLGTDQIKTMSDEDLLKKVGCDKGTVVKFKCYPYRFEDGTKLSAEYLLKHPHMITGDVGFLVKDWR